MAELAVASETFRQPVGDRVQKTFRVDAFTGAAVDQWIVTGFSQIDAIIGYALIGITAHASTCNFVMNAQGTGAVEDSSPGDLGIECLLGTSDLYVTVVGRP